LTLYVSSFFIFIYFSFFFNAPATSEIYTLSLHDALPISQEHHVAHLGVHVAGFETSPYGIEWIRFEPHCHVPEIVRIVPHIAFAVVYLDEALKGREILI